jgi:hypothetical protein
MGGLEELGYFLFDFYPPFIEKEKAVGGIVRAFSCS